MKGIEEVEDLKRRTQEALQRYVELARGLGFHADYRMSIGTEAVAEAERLSLQRTRMGSTFEALATRPGSPLPQQA
jgi:hypothetical protein